MKINHKEVAFTRDEKFICPEAALLYAVLERAILDASGDKLNAYGGQTRKSAIRWLFDKDEDEYTAESFSFSWICQHLGACPMTARKRILKYLKTNNHKWGGRTSWQFIAKLIMEDAPTLADHSMFFGEADGSDKETILDEEL